jgi:polysaccharide biosynthesis protein PslH
VSSLRIMWVKIGGLWPLTSGGRLRSYHTLVQLARRHHVTVVTTHDPQEAGAEPASWARAGIEVFSTPFAPIKRGTVGFARALARSYLSGLPVDLWKVQVPGVRITAERLLEQDAADVCIVDFLSAMPNVPDRIGRPLILFEHNVESLIWKRLRDMETRLPVKALLEIEWRKMRRYEMAACRRADLTLAVSETDRTHLAALAPGACVESINTGVDTEYFSPNGIPEDPYELVFTGSMDWYPNEDAMLHFVERILPLVRREIPQVRTTVVGRNPSERLRSVAAAAGIQVTGTVDDVRPYVARAAIYIVPLRVGGGTRLKIFEALAMGKAVVATSVGAEGLPLRPDHEFVQADDPPEFATAVVSLLRNPERRRAIATQGRRLVEERYSWRQIAQQFEGWCEEVVRCG